MQEIVPLTLLEGYQLEALEFTNTMHFSILDLVGSIENYASLNQRKWWLILNVQEEEI